MLCWSTIMHGNDAIIIFGEGGYRCLSKASLSSEAFVPGLGGLFGTKIT